MSTCAECFYNCFTASLHPTPGPEELYLASVCCLSCLVDTVAFSFPLKQAKVIRINVHLHQSLQGVGHDQNIDFSLQIVSSLPRELLAEAPRLNMTEALLHLLQCCLVSGYPPLLPSLSAAVHVFSQYSNYPNHKVGSQVTYS